MRSRCFCSCKNRGSLIKNQTQSYIILMFKELTVHPQDILYRVHCTPNQAHLLSNFSQLVRITNTEQDTNNWGQLSSNAYGTSLGGGGATKLIQPGEKVPMKVFP
jgi:hypothetical protein